MESIDAKITSLQNEIENLKGVIDQRAAEIDQKAAEIEIIRIRKKAEDAKASFSKLQEKGDIQSLVAFLYKFIPQTRAIPGMNIGRKWTKIDFRESGEYVGTLMRFDETGDGYSSNGKVPLFNLFTSPYERTIDTFVTTAITFRTKYKL